MDSKPKDRRAILEDKMRMNLKQREVLVSTLCLVGADMEQVVDSEAAEDKAVVDLVAEVVTWEEVEEVLVEVGVSGEEVDLEEEVASVDRVILVEAVGLVVAEVLVEEVDIEIYYKTVGFIIHEIKCFSLNQI